MKKFKVESPIAVEEDCCILKVPVKLWNMFKNGEVYLNSTLLSEVGSLDEDDFLDDYYAFVSKETLENSDKFFYNEKDHMYADEDDFQMLVSYQHVKDNWEFEEDELANKTVKFRWYFY